MICFHHNDADGRCAGAIVRKYVEENRQGFKFERREYIEVDYGREFTLPEIEPGETIFIVDYHFEQPGIMNQILMKNDKVYWFDHHKTTREIEKRDLLSSVPGLRDFESKLSGCELVWTFLFASRKMPRAVELIGDRDKWAWKYGEETAKFNEALKLHPHQPTDEVWVRLLSENGNVHTVAMREDEGRICLKHRDMICEEICSQFGYEVTWGSYRCFVVNMRYPGGGSELFGDRMKQYDICISTWYTKPKWTMIMYSTEVDVSEIAKAHGGGGHVKAAGFTAETLPAGIM